jgi:hypothetical protein
MTKKDELSPDHLKWLVEKRSENQGASLLLYCLLKKHSIKIRKHHEYVNIAQGLVSISFSLWRAVFLSDTFGDMHRTLEDAEDFLGKLILDNAISYPQDRNAREWTFGYYVGNAHYRLARIALALPKILPGYDMTPKDSSKEEWEASQTALITAVANFEQFLEEQID